ncbi:hypothetical protein DL240_14220 [Lujinxingia litoralis]|uniref:Uncharacterized protein n=1 Tax=Lujinxingia litoralis TaxID=2211119 RepID=A0A328C5J9_9DELT|nr:hypothetical protein [Lujinxingia litoralis]RAL21276.1 hypothetical protein DL240_14220 [Lujinxingia litoralis]
MPTSSQSPGRFRPPTARPGALLVLLCAWALAGCPGFEDELSGHYRQSIIGELDDQALAVDLFRFGDEVRAVVRFYTLASASSREDAYAPDNQTRCAWTSPAPFDVKAGTFELRLQATARHPGVDLSGSFDAAGNLQLLVAPDDVTSPTPLVMEPTGGTPNAACQTIDDLVLRARFGNASPQGLDPQTYTLRNPVFSLLWVGVEAVDNNGALVYVAINRTEPSVRLEPGRHFTPADNALEGDLRLSVPSPPERILARSGTTRYGLAHLVVIDDAQNEGRFGWDISAEPIVATSLERGRVDDAPEGVETNGWGRAIFFVEGSLNQLDAGLRARIEGLEEASPNQHFYIAQVFFYNEDVVALRLPPRPRPGLVPNAVDLQLTTDHLEAREVLLPRLFHYN